MNIKTTDWQKIQSCLDKLLEYYEQIRVTSSYFMSFWKQNRQEMTFLVVFIVNSRVIRLVNGRTGVNFINILHTHFAPIFLRQKCKS